MPPPLLLNATAIAMAGMLRSRVPSVADESVLHYEPFASGLRPPAITIGGPNYQLVPYGGGGDSERPANTNLGYFDWNMVWRVTLYVALDHAEHSQELARDISVEIVEAFRADPTLGNAVEDASVVSCASGYNDEDVDRRLIVLEHAVEVYTPTPT